MTERVELVELAKAAILADLRDRRLLKWLFAEDADTNPVAIGYIDAPIESAVQNEIAESLARAAIAAIPTAQAAGMSIGTAVRKVSGYTFNGEVRAAFTNSRGELRYVCELVGENGGGMLHIFSPTQIEAALVPPAGE